MNSGETEFALEPTTFHSMQEAHELADNVESPAGFGGASIW